VAVDGDPDIDTGSREFDNFYVSAIPLGHCSWFLGVGFGRD
jgi:hypothetical protein